MKIAIVAALLLAVLVPATASAGTIAGKLPRKGKPATVRVVRAETAEVVAAKQGSRYRLKVPRGAYVVRGTAGKRTFSSRVVRVGRRTAKPKLRRARASAAGGPTLATVAVDPHIAITGLEGYTGGLEIDGVLITELFGVDCANGGEVKVVEVRNRDALEREIELSNSKYFDPKTRLRANFVKPDTIISGHGSVAGGNVTLDLAMRGRVNGSSSVTLPVSQLLDAAAVVASDLKGQICRSQDEEGEPAPPAPPVPGSRLGYRGSLGGSATITSQTGVITETWSSDGVRFSRTQPSSDSAPNFEITDGSLTFSVSGNVGPCSVSGTTAIPLAVTAGGAESTLDLAPPDDSYLAVGFPNATFDVNYTCPGGDPFTVPYAAMNEFLRTSAGFERRTPGPDGALSGTANATRGGTQLQWSWALRPLI